MKYKFSLYNNLFYLGFPTILFIVSILVLLIFVKNIFAIIFTISVLSLVNYIPTLVIHFQYLLNDMYKDVEFDKQTNLITFYDRKRIKNQYHFNDIKSIKIYKRDCGNDYGFDYFLWIEYSFAIIDFGKNKELITCLTMRDFNILYNLYTVDNLEFSVEKVRSQFPIIMKSHYK
jgi:hypothetical protein